MQRICPFCKKYQQPLMTLTSIFGVFDLDCGHTIHFIGDMPHLESKFDELTKQFTKKTKGHQIRELKSSLSDVSPPHDPVSIYDTQS